MPDLFGVATHRIIYKSVNFGASKTVTGYFWSPTLVKSGLQTFTEIGEGLYYLDYSFVVLGTYPAIFYENSVKTVSSTFRVTSPVVTLSDADIDAIFDEVVEGTLTLRKIIRVLLAVMAGKSSGGGTSVIKFNDNADTKARITAQVDAEGNRLVVLLDGD